MSRFNEAFQVIIGHEGGYQNLYNDHGNWTGGKVGVGVLKGTKYGISAASYPTRDIKNLTLDDARKIYKENYWDRINGDALEPALALVAFDFAVNSGVSRAIDLLNKTDDVFTYNMLRRKLIRNFNLYNAVISGNKNGKTYGRVWEERIDHLDEVAAQWAVIYPKTPPVASPEPQQPPSKLNGEVVVLLDTGGGFTALTERYENDGLTVNVVDGKVYIRYYRK
jgi:lysozyme family protein